MKEAGDKYAKYGNELNALYQRLEESVGNGARQAVAQYGEKAIEERKKFTKSVETIVEEHKTMIDNLNELFDKGVNVIETTKADFLSFDDVANKRERYDKQLITLKSAYGLATTLEGVDDILNQVKFNVSRVHEMQQDWYLVFIKKITVHNISNSVWEKIIKYHKEENEETYSLSEVIELYKKEIDNKNYIKGSLSYVKAMSEIFKAHNVEHYISDKEVKDSYEDGTRENLENGIKNGFSDGNRIIERCAREERRRRILFATVPLISAIILLIVCVWKIDIWINEFEEVLYFMGTVAYLIISIVILRKRINAGESESIKKFRVRVNEGALSRFRKGFIDGIGAFAEYADKLDAIDKKNGIDLVLVQANLVGQYAEKLERYEQLANEYLPKGLYLDTRLMEKIITLMEEGEATDYKEACRLAKDVIAREDKDEYEREMLESQARAQEEHRREVMRSQARAEALAKKQAESAQRAEEYAKRQAESAQRQADYAKETAKSNEKLLELERERDRRERELYDKYR